MLGSRATDLLSGVGSGAGRGRATCCRWGRRTGEPVPVDTVRPRRPGRELRLRLGPREDWFEPDSVEALSGSSYVVGSASNRIGLRLEGEQIRWRGKEELPSEGMVLGAVQVPPNGQPVVFLNDHPTTGGYPVIGVVLADDLPRCAQLRPGDEITLRVV